MKNQSVGRPVTSCNVHIVPELNKSPDIEKLGRAFISVATKSATKQKNVPSEKEELTTKQSIIDSK